MSVSRTPDPRVPCHTCNGNGELGTDVRCTMCGGYGEVCACCGVKDRNGACDCARCECCGVYEYAAEFDGALCVGCAVSAERAVA